MNGTNYRKIIAMTVLGLTAAVSLPTAYANDAHHTATAETAPKTAAEIWTAIDKHVAELKAVVASGKLGEAHEHAFAVRDLVRTLPDHSASLKPEALAKIKADVKFVDTIAARIDKAGDSNDKAGTEENLTKLEAILKTMKSEYPA